jgi:NTP pyrophosphatase (non-canonical NTP hydrolase)
MTNQQKIAALNEELRKAQREVEASKRFSGLTPAEDERLAVLEEECAEVIQAINKIRRHGWQSTHPDFPSINNRASLTREIGDMVYALELLIFNGDVSEDLCEKAMNDKAARIGKYLHHNKAAIR